MDEEKRYADTYEIIHSFKIGRTEVIIGEDQNKPDYPYLVANYEENDILGRYFNTVGCDDYAEVAELFSERIAEEAKKIQKENDITLDGYNRTPIGLDGCHETTWEDDINGKIIVIKSSCLKREFRNPLHQLKLVSGGFGASAKSRGTAVYCKDLFTGKETRFNRIDVLGTVEKDELPDWAKKLMKENEKMKSPASREER